MLLAHPIAPRRENQILGCYAGWEREMERRSWRETGSEDFRFLFVRKWTQHHHLKTETLFSLGLLHILSFFSFFGVSLFIPWTFLFLFDFYLRFFRGRKSRLKRKWETQSQRNQAIAHPPGNLFSLRRRWIASFLMPWRWGWGLSNRTQMDVH